MFAGVILPFDVCNCKNSISIEVDLLECLSRKLSSELIHWAYDNSNELIEVNITIAIEIKGFEQVFYVLWIYINLKISETFLELIHIKTSAIVIVHYLKLSSESDHSSASSLLKFVSESLNNHALELWSWLCVLDDSLGFDIYFRILCWLRVVASLVWVSWS